MRRSNEEPGDIVPGCWGASTTERVDVSIKWSKKYSKYSWNLLAFILLLWYNTCCGFVFCAAYKGSEMKCKKCGKAMVSKGYCRDCWLELIQLEHRAYMGESADPRDGSGARENSDADGFWEPEGSPS